MLQRAVIGVALLSGCTSFGSDATPPLDAGTSEAGDAAPPVNTDSGGVDPYAAAVLSDRPILYWRLGEASGDFSDASGKGHVGRSSTVQRSETSLVARTADRSVRLSSGQFLESTPTQDLDFVGNAPYTLECWTRIDAVPMTDADILTRAELDSGIGIFIEVNSSKVIASRRGSSEGVNHGGHELSLGVPHHIVTTYDGTAMRVYIDGTNSDGLTKTAIQLQPQTYAVMLGRTSKGQSQFNGWIDEVAIYDRALDEARISAHAQLGR